jgi:hypothetical protein
MNAPAGARAAGSTSMGEAAEDAARAGSTLASKAQRRMSGLLRGQMEAGADYVGVVSQSAHEFADTLDDKAPEIARLMHKAADRADRLAQDVRDKSPDELFDMASDYARRNPRVFFGGAIALGFLLSRFLKSGSQNSRGYASSENDMGAGLTGGYGAGVSGAMGAESMGSGAMGGDRRTSRREFDEGAQNPRNAQTKEGSHA